MSLLKPELWKNQLSFNAWKTGLDQVNEQMHFAKEDFVFQKTMFGDWTPRTNDAHLKIYSGATLANIKENGPVAVYVLLNDEKDKQKDEYEKEWNGFWQFCNMMQFLEEFVGVSYVGMERMEYTDLPVTQVESELDENEPDTGDPVWNRLKEMIFDEKAKAFIDLARNAGFPAPDEEFIGCDLARKDGEVIATVEVAWPENKVAFLTSEQLADKEKLELMGWRILSLSDMADVEPEKIFGGAK